MLKNLGKYFSKKITKLGIKSSIKYIGCGFLYFYGIAIIPLIGLEGVAVAGLLIYTGVVDYGIDKIVDSSIEKITEN